MKQDLTLFGIKWKGLLSPNQKLNVNLNSDMCLRCIIITVNLWVAPNISWIRLTSQCFAIIIAYNFLFYEQFIF